MSGARLSRWLVAALVAGAATTAVVVLNLLLLSRAAAQNDPVGRLTPRAHVPSAPAWVVRPQHGPVEDHGADD